MYTSIVTMYVINAHISAICFLTVCFTIILLGIYLNLNYINITALLVVLKYMIAKSCMLIYYL